MSDEIKAHTAKVDKAFTRLGGKLGSAVASAKGAMKELGVPWDCIAGGFEAALGKAAGDDNADAVAKIGGALLSFVPGANVAMALADLGPALKKAGDGPLTVDKLKELMAQSAQVVGEPLAQDVLNGALPGSGTVLALTGSALANAAQAVTDGKDSLCAKEAAKHHEQKSREEE